VIDDGAVFYLNGAEIYRVGMTNPIATATPRPLRGRCAYEGPFPLTVTNLLPGLNLLAAEVHQVSAGSSDVVFGAQLDSLLVPSQMPPAESRLDALSRRPGLL